jgi:hypothetical protein
MPAYPRRATCMCCSYSARLQLQCSCNLAGAEQSLAVPGCSVLHVQPGTALQMVLTLAVKCSMKQRRSGPIFIPCFCPLSDQMCLTVAGVCAHIVFNRRNRQGYQQVCHTALQDNGTCAVVRTVQSPTRSISDIGKS